MLTRVLAAFSRLRCCSVFFSTVARRTGVAEALAPPASSPSSWSSPGSSSTSDSSSSPWHCSLKADSWRGGGQASEGPGLGRPGGGAARRAGRGSPGWRPAPPEAGPAAAPASRPPSASAAPPRGLHGAGSGRGWGRGEQPGPGSSPGELQPRPSSLPSAPTPAPSPGPSSPWPPSHSLTPPTAKQPDRAFKSLTSYLLCQFSQGTVWPLHRLLSFICIEHAEAANPLTQESYGCTRLGGTGNRGVMAAGHVVQRSWKHSESDGGDGRTALRTL